MDIINYKKIKDLEDRFTEITTEEQEDAEVIDARDGEDSLKDRLDSDYNDLSDGIEQNEKNIKLKPDIIDFNLQQLTNNNSFSSWPQGSVFSYDGTVYCLYNEGEEHMTSNLKVMMIKSDDKGETWSEPTSIYDNPDEDKWTKGATAWSAGATEDGDFYCIVRLRADDYDADGDTEHRLIKSTDEGDSWSDVRTIDFDSDGEVPVLYHDFEELPNGELAICYHFGHGEVGVIKTDDEFETYTNNDIVNDATLVESTILYDEDIDKTIGFLRTQDPDEKNITMWHSDDYAETFETVETDIDIEYSPFPIINYDNYFYGMAIDRKNLGGSRKGKILLCRAEKEEALTWDDWEQYTIGYVAGREENDASGAGVPAVAAVENKIFWFYASETTLDNPNIIVLTQTDLQGKDFNYQHSNDLRPVTEQFPQSGENENGYWVKYKNGTMECSAVVEISYDRPGRCSGDWEYPKEFFDIPNLQITLAGGADDYTPDDDEIGHVKVFGENVKKDECGTIQVFRVKGMTDFEDGDFVKVHITAKGRWREYE